MVTHGQKSLEIDNEGEMITPQYINFFNALEKNNNREWFHAHKMEYETHVKVPFLQLLDELIARISEFDNDISIKANDTLFRINRDVRFSKDKTPYNIMMKASISPGGKKSILPGYYLGISATTIHIGGGLLHVSPGNLKKIRSTLADEPGRFQKIIDAKKFIQHFECLKGEKAKRLDASLHVVQQKLPAIANKQFYAMTVLPVKEYLNSKKITDAILNRFQSVSPLIYFLNKALK